jgi:hypothetical protein
VDTGTASALAALGSLLIPGEELQTYAVQRLIFALTHRRVIVGATTGRLIVVHRNLISGFTPIDERWQDVHDAQVQVGMIGATLTVTVNASADLASGGGASRTIRITGLRKEQAQEVYRMCQYQAQAWREKRRIRDLEEMRARSGGVQIATGGAGPSALTGGDGRSPEERLQRAKEMLSHGLLTDAEYEQIKARVLSEL